MGGGPLQGVLVRWRLRLPGAVHFPGRNADHWRALLDTAHSWSLAQDTPDRPLDFGLSVLGPLTDRRQTSLFGKLLPGVTK